MDEIKAEWTAKELDYLTEVESTTKSTQDWVIVVRCKDCRFYRYYDGAFGKGWMCFENNTARHGDDYCSRGERRENNV